MEPFDNRFSSPSVEKRCMKSLVNYWEKVKKEGDFSDPAKEALRYLSFQLDMSAKKAFDELAAVLRSSAKHEKRIIEINRQDTTVGKSDLSKTILRQTSPFEQMVALSDWLGQKTIRTTHTFVFAHKEDDYIPVKVAYSRSTPPTLMHVVLGSTKGSHKAPKYADWAQDDPREDPDQQRFIYALEGLETVRQPHYAAATVIKGTAFESRHITHEWRYGLEKGCVELPNQAKNHFKKLASAGLNLTALAEKLPDDVNILKYVHFEDYADEGLREEDFEVSLASILKAAKKALKNTDAIDQIMRKLLIAKIGPVSTPSLQEYIAREILR